MSHWEENSYPRWETRITCPRCFRWYVEYFPKQSIFCCEGCGTVPISLLNPLNLGKPKEIKITGELQLHFSPGLMPDWVIGIREYVHE